MPAQIPPYVLTYLNFSTLETSCYLEPLTKMCYAKHSMDCLVNETLTDFGCIPNDPVGFVEKFYGIGLSLIGGVAVLGIIYAGYILMTSQGNPMQVRKGKRYLYSSIAGLLLAVFALVFIQVITVNVLKIPGFSP